MFADLTQNRQHKKHDHTGTLLKHSPAEHILQRMMMGHVALPSRRQPTTLTAKSGEKPTSSSTGTYLDLIAPGCAALNIDSSVNT